MEHKTTALEPQHPILQLVDKIHQEDTTRSIFHEEKTKTESTLEPKMNSINSDFENFTDDDIRVVKQDIASDNKVVQQNHSIDTILKKKQFF